MTLPSLPPSFRWRQEAWGHALACIPLESRAQHLFTTRQLSLPPADARQAWDVVAASLATTVDHVYRIKQVHGRAVRVITASDDNVKAAAQRPEADALVSDVPGVVLAVQVADCVPLLITDRHAGVAAAVHAGWRGTAAGIVRHTVDALRQLGAQPEQLVVAMGPSIGLCCYEVGVELIDAFRSAGAEDEQLERWFVRHRGELSAQGESTGSLRLDLWRANTDQLIAAGVAPNDIHLAQVCTQTHAAIFDSYRVAGPRAGRMIAAIKVPHV